MNQAIQEAMQSNRELYEKKSESIQKAIEEAEAQGKAANEAILERQNEMKQLREQYAEKENEAKILLKRPTSSRAASVPAESPRLAKKKEKSRVRAEQHRVATAQDRFESWRDYESKYPEELDYYEIARWAKEWSIKQKRIKTAKGQRGSPTSRDAPKHVKDAEMALKPDRAFENEGAKVGERQERASFLHDGPHAEDDG